MKYTLLILLVVNGYFANSQDSLSRANNKFAYEIYRATKSDNENFFISPFSLNIALSTINVGAVGNTQQGLDDLLGTKKIIDKSANYEKWISKTTNLTDSINSECVKNVSDKLKLNQIFVANSLWIKDGFGLKEGFENTIKNQYSSEIFRFNPNKLDVENEKLNLWISEKTHGKINEIAGLTSNTQLSIINSIYFLGKWSLPFDSGETEKGNFHTIERTDKEMYFMHQKANCNYFENDNFQSISLPYKCNQFSMLLILPKERYGLEQLEEILDEEFVEAIQSTSKSKKVIISIPKLSIESEIFPKENLIEMGYENIFSDNSDFSGISETALKVGKITHKTFIEISEKSTEASAVSKIDMILTGAMKPRKQKLPKPKIFNADHAFQFLIIDNRTKAILFIGRYVK